jgi:hypothetical protein
VGSVHRIFGSASLVALALVLSGCANIEERRKAFTSDMDSWVDHQADELIIARGPPTNSATLSDGGRVLEYSSSAFVTSGYSYSYPYYWSAYPYNGFVYVDEFTCKVLFRVSQANRIQSWSALGNACY